MALKRFKLIFLVLFILLTTTVSAVTITTEPNELIFENVLNNGYAEKTIKLSSDSPGPVQISLSATEPIKQWVSFEPVTASVSSASPTEFKVIIKPSNAALGIYQGFLVISVVSSGSELTTSVITSIGREMKIEITDQEITQAAIKDVVIKDTEQDSPIKVSVTVQNQGNIALTPFFQINILDVTKSKILKSAISDKKAILPSSTDVIELNIPNDLALGTYWAQITASLEDNWILGKRLIKFNIVEKGTLPSVEEKPTVSKEEKPIPLTLTWPVILMWLLILAFVVWTIAKKPSKKK